MLQHILPNLNKNWYFLQNVLCHYLHESIPAVPPDIPGQVSAGLPPFVRLVRRDDIAAKKVRRRGRPP